MKLKEAMPYEFSGCEYEDIPAQKFKDVEVIAERKYGLWPGTHRNVFYWVILENGYAVGWNENPARGWSFPVHKM